MGRKENVMKRSSTRIFTMFSAVLAGLAISIALQTSPLGKTAWAASPKAPPPKLGVDETPLSRDARAGTSFAPVIKKVAPSVVNIYSTVTVKERPLAMNPFSDPFLRRFFGEDFE